MHRSPGLPRLTTGATTRARVLRGFTAAGFHQLVNIALQLGLVPVFASSWGASRYGLWIMLFTIPSFLALSDLGFGTAAGTEMTIKVARGQSDDATRTFQSAWAIILAFSASLCLLLVAIVWAVPDAVLPAGDLIAPREFRLTASAVVAYGWACLQGGLFVGALRSEGLFVVGAFISAFIHLFEGLVAAAVAIAGGSLLDVAAAYAFSRLCGDICLLITARLHAPWMKLGFRRTAFREIKRLLPLATASMTIPISLSTLLQGTALAIGAATTPMEVAVFSTVRTLTRAGVQLGGLPSQAAVPEFSVSYARSERQRLTNIYLFTMASAALILVPAFLILVLFGPRLLGIWTHGSIHCSWTMMALMSGSMVLNGLWTPTSNLLQAMNRQSLFAYPYLILAFATIPCTYFLSLRFGAVGGAFSFVLMDLLMFALVYSLAAHFIAKPRDITFSLHSLYQTAILNRPAPSDQTARIENVQADL